MSLIASQLASRMSARETAQAEDAVVTVRPSSTAIFAIDSNDRYKTVVDQRAGIISPYNFIISKNESLFNGFFKRIALTEIVFPYYIPNINDRTKELFYNSSIVGNGSIQLSIGFYTPAGLAAAVQAALIADGVLGVTVTYMPSGYFLIDAGAGNTIAFLPATSVPPGSNQNQFQLFDLMGFDVSNQLPAQIQTTNVTRCRYTEYVDIVCSQLTYNQDLKDGSSDTITRDILARIYLEGENDQPLPVLVTATPSNISTTVENTVPGCYPITIYRQFKNPKFIKWNNSQPIGNLVFQVYDSHGDLLADLTSQAYKFPDWRMSLLVSEN